MGEGWGEGGRSVPANLDQDIPQMPSPCPSPVRRERETFLTRSGIIDPRYKSHPAVPARSGFDRSTRTWLSNGFCNVSTLRPGTPMNREQAGRAPAFRFSTCETVSAVPGLNSISGTARSFPGSP
jgi:hypothetical protein